ncbi:MAG TPA: DUF4259 domain-containing protein [Reyranella sp.]|jgi:hypothetical protein|nr:DUF4259 domain-containing protein [Reyranella sp.]
MASWGAGLIEDDLATDFANQIVDGGAVTLRGALSRALQASGHLLYEPSVCALIAAETVAALAGRPAKAMPDALAAWTAGHRRESSLGELRSLATAAVERVREDSEIAELWARSETFTRWIGQVDDLLARLAAP